MATWMERTPDFGGCAAGLVDLLQVERQEDDRQHGQHDGHDHHLDERRAPPLLPGSHGIPPGVGSCLIPSLTGIGTSLPPG